MILLDAFALVALLAEEQAAGQVDELLRRGECAIGTVNLAEVADVSGRVHGLAAEQVRPAVELLAQTGQLELLAPTANVAWRAAALRQSYYVKRTCEISLADCFLLASAGPDDEIATADPAVAAVARAEKLALIGLPDSAGSRP